MDILNILTLFSGGHLIVLVAVIVLLFGGKKIPELMSGIGKGMKGFKKSIKDEEEPKEAPKEEIKKEIKE